MVINGGRLNLNGYVVTLGGVYLANGVIDMTSGALIVNTANFAFVPNIIAGGLLPNTAHRASSSMATRRCTNALVGSANLRRQDYNAGFWNGTNGILSSTAAASTSGRTAVGWIDNYWIGGYFTSFRSAAVSQNQSIISYAYYGDADFSGTVDVGDLGLLLASLGQTTGLPARAAAPSTAVLRAWRVDGDYPQSGSVDVGDHSLLIWNAGQPALW